MHSKKLWYIWHWQTRNNTKISYCKGKVFWTSYMNSFRFVCIVCNKLVYSAFTRRYTDKMYLPCSTKRQIYWKVANTTNVSQVKREGLVQIIFIIISTNAQLFCDIESLSILDRYWYFCCKCRMSLLIGVRLSGI